MERAAREIETELVDLSTSTLRDLDHGRTFHFAIQRLMDAVESPPTIANAAQQGEGCPRFVEREQLHPGTPG